MHFEGQEPGQGTERRACLPSVLSGAGNISKLIHACVSGGGGWLWTESSAGSSVGFPHVALPRGCTHFLTAHHQCSFFLEATLKKEKETGDYFLPAC